MDRNAYQQYLAAVTRTGTVEDIERALKDMLWSGLALHAALDFQSEFWPRLTEAMGHVALWVHERHPSVSLEDRLLARSANATVPEPFSPEEEGQERESIYRWVMAAYQELQGVMLESQGLAIETRV